MTRTSTAYHFPPHKLRALMARQRMSQAELARRCGVSQPTIYGVLARGRVSISLGGRIAFVLGVRVEDFGAEERPHVWRPRPKKTRAA